MSSLGLGEGAEVVGEIALAVACSRRGIGPPVVAVAERGELLHLQGGVAGDRDLELGGGAVEDGDVVVADRVVGDGRVRPQASCGGDGNRQTRSRRGARRIMLDRPDDAPFQPAVQDLRGAQRRCFGIDLVRPPARRCRRRWRRPRIACRAANSSASMARNFTIILDAPGHDRAASQRAVRSSADVGALQQLWPRLVDRRRHPERVERRMEGEPDAAPEFRRHADQVGEARRRRIRGVEREAPAPNRSAPCRSNHGSSR